MTDRLTAETARVGMRVRCVDGSPLSRTNVVQGETYTIARIRDELLKLREIGEDWLYLDRFIPADPQPDQSLRAILSDRAPELLAALVAWRQARTPWSAFGSPSNLALYDAIERAGLLPEPSQPAPLPAMWCGADAFTQENNDGR